MNYPQKNTILLNPSLIQKFKFKNVTDTIHFNRPSPLHHPDCVLLEAV